MIREIYTRNPEDPNYVYGLLEHQDAIESIITKVKMLLGTKQGSVFGDLNFGIGIEDLIFETRINKSQLEEKIKTQFDQYISETKDFKITPAVSFGKDEGYEYCLIDILINENKMVGILIK